MKRYEGSRDELKSTGSLHAFLDAAQLVKHAFALRSEVAGAGLHRGLAPILLYVYAEPEYWPRDRKPVDEDAKRKHEEKIRRFANNVKGDEVTFVFSSYRQLLKTWSRDCNSEIRAHVDALIRRFSP